MFHCFIETGSHVAQAGFKLTLAENDLELLVLLPLLPGIDKYLEATVSVFSKTEALYHIQGLSGHWEETLGTYTASMLVAYAFGTEDTLLPPLWGHRSLPPART